MLVWAGCSVNLLLVIKAFQMATGNDSPTKHQKLLEITVKVIDDQDFNITHRYILHLSLFGFPSHLSLDSIIPLYTF